MAKPRTTRPASANVPGSETEVGLPQTVGVRAGGALEPASHGGVGDDIATVHAGGGLEPIPVATPVGTPVLPPRAEAAPSALPPGPFDQPEQADDTSGMLPADAPAARPTEAVSARARSETATSSRRMTAASGRRSSASARASVSGRSAAASASGRNASASGRNSRRLSASSWRGAAEGNLRSLLWIAVGILAAIVAVVVVIILATHHSEGRQRGGAALAEAQRQLDGVRNALANHRPVEARKAYAAALAALTGEPALAGAVSPPPLGDKQAIPDLAARAAGLKAEVEAEKDGVAQAEALAAVDANLAGMRQRFARLGDAATDLDALERDAKAYCDNPVDPKGAPDASLAATYQQQVGEVKLRLPDIGSERNRRRIARTVAPVDKLRPQIIDLIGQEHYGEAQARIADAKGTAPDADFGPLGDEVANAAANAWRSAKNYADTRLADWKSPGATADQRAKALADAKRRLNQVVDNYGIAEYVDQAKAALAGLPGGQ